MRTLVATTKQTVLNPFFEEAQRTTVFQLHQFKIHFGNICLKNLIFNFIINSIMDHIQLEVTKR
jgi:hypothetical protein